MENYQNYRTRILHFVGSNGKYQQKKIIETLFTNNQTDMDKSLYTLITKVKLPNVTFTLSDRKKAIEEAARQIGDTTKKEEIIELALNLVKQYKSQNRSNIKERDVYQNLTLTGTNTNEDKMYLLSVACEQEELRKTDDFILFCDEILENIITNDSSSVLGVLLTDYKEGILADAIDEFCNKNNEFILINDFKILVNPDKKEWEFKEYNHHDGRISVVGVFKQADPSSKEKEDFNKQRILQHICAANPLSRKIEDIPNGIINKIKIKAKNQAIIKDLEKKNQWLKGENQKESVYIDILQKPEVIKAIEEGAVRALTLEEQTLLTIEGYKGAVKAYLEQEKISLDSYYRISL